jgi:hypothetical protein
LNPIRSDAPIADDGSHTRTAGTTLPRRHFLAAGLASLVVATAPRAAQAAGSTPPPGVAAAPYRSQFDGSVYAETNCGPAALGMFLGHFGEQFTTAELRASANQQMHNSDPNNGTSWEALVYAANVRSYQQHSLYAVGKTYRKWSLDDLWLELSSGHPAMLLVRYQYLPGSEGSGFAGDHYVLVLGRDPQGNVVYHDSAFRSQPGAYRTMSPTQVARAWSTVASGIANTAMGLHRIEQVRALLVD